MSSNSHARMGTHNFGDVQIMTAPKLYILFPFWKYIGFLDTHFSLYIIYQMNCCIPSTQCKNIARRSSVIGSGYLGFLLNLQVLYITTTRRDSRTERYIALKPVTSKCGFFLGGFSFNSMPTALIRWDTHGSCCNPQFHLFDVKRPYTCS